MGTFGSPHSLNVRTDDAWLPRLGDVRVNARLLSPGPC
jgi:hypothetical protein